jgi:stage II sporulation protein P
MDEMRKNQELELFYEKERAIGFPRRKARVIFWGRLLFAVTSICLVIVLALGRGDGANGFWGKLFGFTPNNGSDPAGDGQNVTEDTSEEQAEGDDTAAETETIANESTSDGNNAEDESTVEEEKTTGDETAEISSVDLSEAERGSGYIVNYSSKEYDIEGLLEMGFHADLSLTSQAPIVLILHTHTSEGYADYDALEPTSMLKSSVVAIGETLATALNECGIPTVHCTVIHDGEGDAYENAAKTVEAMMRIYPTLEYVIDLHRMILTDNEGNEIKTCSADASAQIRITVSSEGALTKGALSLALCLRRELNSNGAKMCMPIVLTDAEYNAASALYYLKLDVGSLGNTSSEAMAAAERFAEALEALLKVRKH